MNLKDFEKSTVGKCVKMATGYWVFMPNPLPPRITYDQETISLLSKADRLLGELSGTGRTLKNPYLLIGPYIRREAVSSSRIEGTQASLSDLFLFEAAEQEAPKASDVREVRNYVRAMEYGIERVQKLPVSIRLICEIHEILMEGVRGNAAMPGELRRTQNWIGPHGCSLKNATYVPPPADGLINMLGDWEKYHYKRTETPPLIKCAVMHYQFEAIHPFIDGNGRIGRLLIAFFLLEKKCLTQPLLYLSAFFEEYRDEYNTRLLAVSQRGDWAGWIKFFLRGIATQAEDAIVDAKRILSLHAEYQRRIRGTKNVPGSAHRLIEELFSSPVVTISSLSKKWKMSYHSVKTGVSRLVKVGVLRETPQRKRNKLFVATELMELLLNPGRKKDSFKLPERGGGG